jgi:hypothetical protein
VRVEWDRRGEKEEGKRGVTCGLDGGMGMDGEEKRERLGWNGRWGIER